MRVSIQPPLISRALPFSRWLADALYTHFFLKKSVKMKKNDVYALNLGGIN